MYSVYHYTSSTCRVPSFGYPRIKAYLQLPVAFRSLSRPSSAPSAKAFSLRSFSLELSFFSSSLLMRVSQIGCYCFCSLRCSFPFFSTFRKTNLLIDSLFCLLDLFSSIRFSMYYLPLPLPYLLLRRFGRPKWTRTTDLVLIRHAL